MIQFSAAGLVVLPLALAFESMQVRWTADFIYALAWLVLVLSMTRFTRRTELGSVTEKL